MSDETMLCEYRRCGGTGRREVAEPWPARLKLVFPKRTWLVCESCLDLFRREARIRRLDPFTVERLDAPPECQPRKRAAASAKRSRKEPKAPRKKRRRRRGPVSRPPQRPEPRHQRNPRLEAYTRPLAFSEGERFLEVLEARLRGMGRTVRQGYLPLRGHVCEIDGRTFGPTSKKRLARKVRAWIKEESLEQDIYGPEPDDEGDPGDECLFR